MKNDKLDNDSDDLSFLNELTEPIFHQDIMVQKIDKKRSLTLSTEISLRKKMINKMFDVRFGKLFFKFKPESLLDFENKLKKYYFSPNSKFLNHFPRLRKKLLFDKKINYQALNSRINVGSLVYLNEAEKIKTKKEMLNKKENIITFSKNFQTKTNKDTVTNDFYKVKFWQKNSRRLKKFFSKKFESILGKTNTNESISENEKEIKNNNNNDNNNISPKLSIKNLLLNLREEKSSSNKNLPNDNNNKEINEDFKNNINANNIKTEGNNNNYIGNNQNILTNPNKTFNIENIKNNNEIPTMNNLKIYNFNRTHLNNNNMNTINESSLPSITINTNNNTINDNNINKSELILFSRNNKKNKINNSNTINNTNKLKKSLFNSTYKSLNHNSKSKFMESSIKYKRNLSKQVKELNTHTIKCNLKLCKLIDGNYIETLKEKIKKKKNDFDINKDLSDNKINNETKNNKSFLNYYEIEKLKLKNKNNKINSLIKEAKSNINEQNKFKKKELKLFPKKLYKMKDEFALQMVERLYSAHKISREKAPELKEVLKEEREKKHKKKIISLRKKTKDNHEKIVKMGFFLSLEKDKFFLNNKKV